MISGVVRANRPTGPASSTADSTAPPHDDVAGANDAIVEASRLDWTFLRPTRLVPGDTPVDRPAQASFTPNRPPFHSASCAGMEALVLDTLNSPPTYRRSLYL